MTADNSRRVGDRAEIMTTMAQRYLTDDRYVRVVLLPEEG
jgi:hypothetical protein